MNHILNGMVLVLRASGRYFPGVHDVWNGCRSTDATSFTVRLVLDLHSGGPGKHVHAAYSALALTRTDRVIAASTWEGDIPLRSIVVLLVTSCSLSAVMFI
jgi:hypothetical protein